MAKFNKTFCSQCGGEFGPGDSGYSHCDQHAQEDAEFDFDYWFNASDEELEREEAGLHNQMAELQRNLDAMTIAQQVAHHRHFLLRDLLKNRQRLKDPTLNTIDIISQMWRDGIKRCRWRLVKLRIWRATVTYPGTA